MGANVLISIDHARIDLASVHAMLGQTYWSENIPLARVREAISNSVCAGAYSPDGEQIGFARLVTDRATFAYLCDVVVKDSWHGKGVGTRLVGALMELPWVADLRRIVLATRDAHRVYEPFGFASLAAPQSFMEIVRPDIYRGQSYPVPDDAVLPRASSLARCASILRASTICRSARASGNSIGRSSRNHSITPEYPSSTCNHPTTENERGYDDKNRDL